MAISLEKRVDDAREPLDYFSIVGSDLLLVSNDNAIEVEGAEEVLHISMSVDMKKVIDQIPNPVQYLIETYYGNNMSVQDVSEFETFLKIKGWTR